MADNKRKAGPGDARDNKFGKKAKGGASGKWQTPAQAKKASGPVRGGKIEAGDQGIWATCMKGKEGKATEELRALLESSAEKFYGIKSTAEAALDFSDDEAEDVDIEAQIAKEMGEMKPKTKEEGQKKMFQPVFLDVQCVLFFKVRKDIDPVGLCKRICEEAAEDVKNNAGKGRSHRFLNRLSPMSKMGKATDEGLKEVGRGVLDKVFIPEGQEDGREKEKFSYAIRPTIRNHSQLKRGVIIDTVANLISSEHHKVSLTSPDKTILVELYQNVCGLAVVDKNWETLKRYNLNEIYTPTEQRRAQKEELEAAEKAKAGEAEALKKGADVHEEVMKEKSVPAEDVEEGKLGADVPLDEVAKLEK